MAAPAPRLVCRYLWISRRCIELAQIALCMVGFLAAVTQPPITCAIIVMEMIDSHSMVISLMAVALIAKAVSSRMGPELYQQLARGFLENAEPATTANNPTR